jgi:hypothetical protein
MKKEALLALVLLFVAASAQAQLLPEELVICEQDCLKWDHFGQMDVENQWTWLAINDEFTVGGGRCGTFEIECGTLTIDQPVDINEDITWCGGDRLSNNSLALDQMIIENEWPGATAGADYFVEISWCAPITVPEPSSTVGLLAGTLLLAGMARHKERQCT